LGPPPLRVDRVRFAGLVLLGAVGLSVGSLFPSFERATVPLSTDGGAILANVALSAAGWLVAALLVLSARRAPLRLGLGLAAGISLTTTGVALLNFASVVHSGPHIAAAGLWLNLAAAAVADIGTILLVLELRRCGRLGALVNPHPALAIAGLAAVAALCVGFVPRWWGIHLVVTQQHFVRTSYAPAHFNGPWPLIAAGVILLALVVIVVTVALLWRPRWFGGAAIAGVVVGMAAPVSLPLYRAVAAFDPALIGATPAQMKQYGAHANIELTVWLWLSVGALAALAALAVFLFARPDPPGAFEP
jgi:hypothetical protein